MYDLIYSGRNAWETIKKQYPEAKIEDASDMVHRERFSVTLDEKGFDENEYFKFLICSGLSQVSFSFKMSMVTKEKHPKIKRAFDELRKEKPELFKE